MRSEKIRFKRHTFYLPAKKKARKMAGYWDKGCRAEAIRCHNDTHLNAIDPDTVAVFYGATESTGKVLKEVQGMDHPYLYIDNSYFGFQAQTYFRVTWNKVQHNGMGPDGKREKSDGKRWANMGIGIEPWRKTGKHIIITLQSELYFELLHYQSRAGWLEDLLDNLRSYTDRPIQIREKPMTWKDRKLPAFVPFDVALKDAWAVVTLNSATATEALLAGVPAFVLDPESGPAGMSLTDLSQIEKPYYPDERREWCEVLADHQWTLSEISRGVCIHDLNSRKP